jgi:hypothetical protein
LALMRHICLLKINTAMRRHIGHSSAYSIPSYFYTLSTLYWV